jgi:hypothetical protein
MSVCVSLYIFFCFFWFIFIFNSSICVFRYLSFLCWYVCVCVGLAHENFIVWYQILTSHAWWWCLCTSHQSSFSSFCHRKVKWKKQHVETRSWVDHGMCDLWRVGVVFAPLAYFFFQHYLSRCNVKSIYTKTQYLNTHLFLTLPAFMRHWCHLVGMMVVCGCSVQVQCEWYLFLIEGMLPRRAIFFLYI